MITFVLDTPTDIQVQVHGFLRATFEHAGSDGKPCFSLDKRDGQPTGGFITFTCPVIRIADENGITEIKG